MEQRKDDLPLRTLLDMVDEGRIGEAEDMLFELAEDPDSRDLASALLFYSYLNDKPDEFLQCHDFSRQEIISGLRDITAKYGVDGLSDIFL